MFWPMKFIFVIYICLFAAGCSGAAGTNDELLRRLDSAVDERRVWDEAKERRMDFLREQLGSAEGMQRIEVLMSLCDEYCFYRVDSLRRYGALLDAEIDGCSDKAMLDRMRLRSAIVADVTGRAESAYALLSQIETRNLPPADLREFVVLKFSLLNKLVKAATNAESRAERIALREEFKGSRAAFFDASAAEYKWFRAMDLSDAGKRDSALTLILEACETASDSHLRARISADAANMADGALREKILAMSAADDFRASIKEYTSLPKLAEMLFRKGDVERANRYMRCTMEDLIFCNHNGRVIQFAASNEAISTAFSEALASRRRIMIAMIIVVSIFAAAITAALRWALRQNRRIEDMNGDLVGVNEALSARNVALTELNARLKEVNDRLTDANRIKEQYVCHYMDLCSSYIAKIDTYRRSLNKIANTAGAEAVLKELRTPRMADKEWREFYRMFDSTFLDLFPDFVERVNELLADNERIVPKSAGSLNTELRILAVIRLGITDSVKIAYFLNCSLSTIYNYRTKMRNAAVGNRDDFETAVQSITAD